MTNNDIALWTIIPEPERSSSNYMEAEKGILKTFYL